MKKLKNLFAVLLASALMITSFGCADSEMHSGAEQNGSQTTSSATVSGNDASKPQDNGGQQDSGTSSAPVDDNDSTQADTYDTGTSAPVGENANPGDTDSTSGPAISVDDPDENDDPQESSSLSVSYNIGSSWEDSGRQCTQLDFVVKNSTGGDISHWKLTLDLGQDVEVMQIWNASAAESSGSQLHIGNAEYNGQIANGAETTFGCIVKTDKAVQNIDITADGQKVSSSVGGGNNGGNGNDNSGTASTPPQDVQKPPAESDIEVTGKYGLVSDCGQLSVKGTDLVGADGTPVQLRGISTHGIQWFPAFANKSVFKYLRDEWNINVIRLAMYTGAGEGYTDSTKSGIEQTVQNAVDACIELDMYVIVDWHILQDQSPQVRKSDALRFFDYMSEKYADYPNVIYEICNEPNGYASWSGDVKPYAEEVIPVIRKNDPDSVVIVGTPTWSQDIDKALADPLDFDNVMYALHYYAATHTDWLRDRLKNCYNSGLPVMVTEFGNCDASGNGANNFGEAKKWLELLDSLNISYMNWSLCDKAEAASLLKPGASPTGGWKDSVLSENGIFMRDWLKYHD